MCPWSLFVLASLAYLPVYLKKKENSFYLFLSCWIGVIFFIFQIARSKVSNYILPVFPAIAVLMGAFIYDTLLISRRRITFYALLGTLFVIFIMPAGIIVASIKQSAYLTDKMPVYLFAAAFFMLALIAAYFLFRNKLLQCVYALSLFVPVFLCIMPFVQNNFGAYMSSREASEYLVNNYSVNNAILCSKVLVRGVKYYTDKDVVVLDMPGRPLFSPHSITFLNTEEQIADFLRKQGTTYCILKKAGFKAVERIAGEGFRRTLLKIMGDHYILKVEKT
jgi:4-amino-4-deoxy-L-arabinose transferase-like glycosyltransferase